MFQGSAVALVTPFLDDRLNLVVLKELLQFQLQEKSDAIVVCGTTGECPALSNDERRILLETTLEVVQGTVPVIMGTGCNVTWETIERTQQAEDAGADGLLLVTPYYNKCSQDGVYQHFKAVAESTSLPLILYNVPSRTGFNLLPETVARLSEIKNVTGIKEASGNLGQALDIKRLCGDKIKLFSGCDELTLPILSVGGSGVISTSANVAPARFARLVRAFFEGKLDESLRLQCELKPLIDALFLDVNPICVKPAVELLGFQVGPPRLPLSKPSTGHMNTVRTVMQSLHLIH